MNISETCIRRPVMTTLITASLIVFGIIRLSPAGGGGAAGGGFPHHSNHRHAAGGEP